MDKDCNCRIDKNKAKRQRDNWKRRYLNLAKAVKPILNDLDLSNPICNDEPVQIDISKLISLKEIIEEEEEDLNDDIN